MKERRVLIALSAAIFGGLLLDEGFHVFAARLILEGKRLYLDFLFPASLLERTCMRIFGEHRRALHVLASTWTAGAIVLIADLVYRRIPTPNESSRARSSPPLFRCRSTAG